MAPRVKALLVEDDVRLAKLVGEYLTQQSIDVSVVGDGLKAVSAIRSARPDVVLLDLMLPGIDGLEVCRRLRALPETAALPVIMLTAKGEDVDRIVGLEIGADDYLPKPFNPRELLARIRAVLRRATPAEGVHAAPLRVGELTIDVAAREVSVGDRRVVLTHHEFELLLVLARAAGRVLSREQILEALKGGPSDSFDRAVDVHIKNLRAKIEEDPKAPRYIKTARGLGYSLARGA